MRIETIIKEIYTFDELSEESKEKAIEKLYNINVDHEWWEYIYIEAEELGFKITSFDTDRGNCNVELIKDEIEIAQNIIENHGKSRDTHKTATNFLQKYEPLKDEFEDIESCDGDYDYDRYEYLKNELESLESGFQKTLSEDYLSTLRKDYEYFTSKESIIETIKANEYEFTADGNVYHD